MKIVTLFKNGQRYVGETSSRSVSVILKATGKSGWSHAQASCNERGVAKYRTCLYKLIRVSLGRAPMARAPKRKVAAKTASATHNHKVWPKIIRDPIHNIIPFENNECDRLLLDLINTKEFQRLRRIKQLGFSELVFPAANHSRFAHSIGVMHTARRLLSRVRQVTDGDLSTEDQTLVLVAALVHDVGHGPFSHTFEKITAEDHEKRTLEIICDDATEIHRKLSAYDRKLPAMLAVFFDKDVEESEQTNSVAPHLTQIVSSQFDADRFDYLQRDSHATGTDYGRFDLEWLIQHLHLEEKKKRFYLTYKGLYAAEDYVHARNHMYRGVYFHKATRSAEVMLRLLLTRFRDLLKKGGKKQRFSVVPGAPTYLIDAFSGELELEDYLLLDDHTITEFLKCCERSSDSVLNSLASGLIHRRLFKATDVSQNEMTEVAKFTPAVCERLKQLNLDFEYAFAVDNPSDIPYKPYDPDAEKPATQIYVENGRGELKELSVLSESVAALKKKYSLVRYYYPAKIREEIEKIAKSTLKRD